MAIESCEKVGLPAYSGRQCPEQRKRPRIFQKITTFNRPGGGRGPIRARAVDYYEDVMKPILGFGQADHLYRRSE